MNRQIEARWRAIIEKAIKQIAQKNGTADCDASALVFEKPPKPEMGDAGVPMFPLAKVLKSAPNVIAKEVAECVSADPEAARAGEVFALGPYVNVKFNRGSFAKSIITEINESGSEYGSAKTLSGKKIMIEFSSPNTNKPLHLGHLRNDALGESISRILKFCGAEIKKVCIINDRGVHICKSMLAYQKFGNGQTPETAGVKSDRFVGDYYVRFAQWAKEYPQAETEAQDMLRRWEAGDQEIAALWRQMNEWAVDGIKKTYARTGVSFDKYYFESGTYLEGKNEVLKGLENGLFYKDETGAVAIDLTEDGLDKKVLLRSDGTSVYITQDIGTAISRRRDWPFDRLIYVVGSEQIYHFKVLFLILKKLGFVWAESLYHLSYGMVNLPDGKMKSREGTVVDADDLIDQLRDMALNEIRSKNREAAVGNAEAVAEKIALGALHYFLLQASPVKDMTFNPKESLSFNGDTGPYLQYMGARLSSLLKKAEEKYPRLDFYAAASFDLLCNDLEWDVIKQLAEFPNAVETAAAENDPSQIAGFIYSLCKSFSRFYHDCPILDCGGGELTAARIMLAKSALRVLQTAMDLILIPFTDAM